MLKHFYNNMLASNLGGIGKGIANPAKLMNITVLPEPELIMPAIDFRI